MKKKEHALKLALSVGHAAKSDAAEMRRKWAMASELAETMTRRCEEASIEVRARAALHRPERGAGGDRTRTAVERRKRTHTRVWRARADHEEAAGHRRTEAAGRGGAGGVRAAADTEVSRALSRCRGGGGGEGTHRVA